MRNLLFFISPPGGHRDIIFNSTNLMKILQYCEHSVHRRYFLFIFKFKMYSCCLCLFAKALDVNGY